MKKPVADRKEMAIAPFLDVEDNTGKIYTRAVLFVQNGIRVRGGGEEYCSKILK